MRNKLPEIIHTDAMKNTLTSYKHLKGLSKVMPQGNRMHKKIIML